MDLACRVCFLEQEVMVDIFEEVENLQSDLSLLLQKCGDLEVKKDDMYSHYLCKDCTSDLLVAAKFREKCERAKVVIAELVKEHQGFNEQREELEAPYKPDNVDYNSHINNDDDDDDDDGNDILNEFLCIKKRPMKPTEFNQQEEQSSSVGVDENHFSYIVANEADEDSELVKPSDEMIEVKMEFDVEESPAEIDLMEMKTSEQNPGFVVLNELAENQNEEELDTPCDFIEEENSENFSVDSLKPNFIVFEDEKDFACDICGAAFKYYINLNRHLQTIHMPADIFACSKCSHSFTTEANIAKHLEKCKSKVNTTSKLGLVRREPIVTNENNICKYCGKKNATFFALTMHMRTHTGERPFKCSQCEKAFKTQSALDVHIKRHYKTPDLACPTCGKRFYETNNLKAHMTIHTGNKPHVCTVCNKRFSRVFLLRNHIRTHTGDRPHKCQYCERSFIQASDRRTHELLHTGERPFQCPQCDKGFKTRSFLKQHMMKYNHCVTNATQYQQYEENTTVSSELVDENLEAIPTEEGLVEDDEILIKFTPEDFKVM